MSDSEKNEMDRLRAYLSQRKGKQEAEPAEQEQPLEEPSVEEKNIQTAQDDAESKGQGPQVSQVHQMAQKAQEAPPPQEEESSEKEPSSQPEEEKAASAEAPKTRETDLKSFLEQKRQKAESGKDKVDEDDPFGGDQMARKYLWNLQKYLERPDIADIKEVVINRPEEIGFEHADGSWEWIEDPALNVDNLEDMARMLANRSGQLFHPGNPILSVKMPGGHRVQIVAGFNAPTGFVFSMRMQRKETFALKDFAMNDEEIKKITECAINQKTLLISGGTGTGKTSFINALIPYIPDHERLISMEDVAELRIPHRNWAPLMFAGNNTTQGDQGVIALLNACLRLRPDRIILGEIRKENAFAFCSAINTGHAGSMATIHANNPKMAVNAVINRVLMNGDMPDSAIATLKKQLIDDVFGVVQLTRKGAKIEAYLKVLDPEDKEMLD